MESVLLARILIDAMVPSSTGRRAVLNTCTLLLVTATSEVPVMENEWTSKYIKERLKGDEGGIDGSYGCHMAAVFVLINVVRECKTRGGKQSKSKRREAVTP